MGLVKQDARGFEYQIADYHLARILMLRGILRANAGHINQSPFSSLHRFDHRDSEEKLYLPPPEVH